jgi:hypothetical protein
LTLNSAIDENGKSQEEGHEAEAANSGRPPLDGRVQDCASDLGKAKPGAHKVEKRDEQRADRPTIAVLEHDADKLRYSPRIPHGEQERDAQEDQRSVVDNRRVLLVEGKDRDPFLRHIAPAIESHVVAKAPVAPDRQSAEKDLDKASSKKNPKGRVKDAE